MDVPSLLDRAASGYPGSAVLSRPYDQNADRHSTDDTVANGEILRCRKGSQRKLTDDRASTGENLVCKFLIFLGVGNVDARTPNRCRPAMSVQSPSMSCRIDTARHPADNDYPASCKVAC